MLEVTFNGMRSWAESCRFVGYGGLVFLSLFGNRNAVRATWAALVGERKRRRESYVKIGETHMRLIDDTLYTTVKAPLDTGHLHMILMHSSATRQASAFESFFYQLGPDPRSQFFSRFSQRCPIPLRPEWRDEIWTIGREANLITPIDGHGLTLHRVDTTKDAWAPLVKTAILAGRLK